MSAPIHIGSMAYSDVVILRTLETLLQRHGPDSVISYQMIADESGASRNTTIRALKRLALAGKIEGRHTRRGYCYRIPDAQFTP